MAKMNILSALVAACALSTLAVAQTEGGRRRLPNPDNIPKANTKLPDFSSRFIVEFSEQGSSKYRKRDGSPDTEGFYEEVKELNHEVVAHQNFTSELFHGTSFEIVSSKDDTLASLEELPDVARIWPVDLVTIPQIARPEDEDSDAAAEALGLGKRQVNPSPFLEKYYPHILTRVEDAHAQGFNGSGVVVAIVDSGIHYNHYALGGGFGPGYRVEGGWDLVGPDYLPGDSELNPGPDPNDCNGHGTLVAGVIGSSEPKLLGVAPAVQFRSYKVFGCLDGTGSDIVVAAFLRAFEDKPDIISGSLGSDNGFAESPIAMLITRIAEAGVLVVTAAGNSGDQGPFYTSSAANGYGSLSVGSLHVRRQHAFDLTATSSSGETRLMKYVPENETAWNLPLDTVGTKGNLTRDFDICGGNGEVKPWRTWNGPDYDRRYKIPDDEVWVLKRPRVGCANPSWQWTSSETMGLAKNILFWNPTDQPDEAPRRNKQFNAVDGCKLPSPRTAFVLSLRGPDTVATINHEDGQWIEDQFDAGYTVKFNFTDDNLEDVSASFASPFSSWGPTLDARLVPQISAHGEDVWSTFIQRFPTSSPWLPSTGTSFSCPYISGVGALFFQSVGGRAKLASCGQNPAEVAGRRIINSGKTAGHSNYTIDPASVAQQGNGIVDAWKVINYATSAHPPIVHLNDSDHFAASHTITIRNRGSTPVTYNITHVVGSTAMTREFGDAYIELDTKIKTDVGLASVKFSTQEVVVPAKGRATFTATFTEPNDVDPMIMAVYGGSIYIAGSNDESIKIPYMGIRGSVKEAQVWETQHGVPFFFVSAENRTQFADGHVFPPGTLPQPYFDYLWSSREYSFDVVNADWKPSDWVYPPVPGKNNFVGSTTFFDMEFQVWRSYPLLLQARSLWAMLNPLGSTYAHGAPVEAGEYRILARAIKTYGEYDKIEDWHQRLSNSFFVAGNSTLKA
ncbi:peptidase S8/S53 domain-containing protein [Plectosphaerella plurivora]|uniref:Peptidase S8/S53 domain-containing protein n=1 Tax=Plectosphaerella plurivora TaxID=936078 RepID=A0A9P8V7V6_9PEZI|nr:peptidase S8/S53 domain-containing protein [Plectosphaerella plurivora]